MSIRRHFRTAGFAGALVFAAAAGEANASGDKISGFRARLDEAARTLEHHKQLRDLTPDERRSIIEFVAGNMLFALLHEMGHTHITEMGLPVLGREEDAADSFAVVTMLKVGTHYAYEVLIEAAMGWFLSAYRDEAKGQSLAFYDEHGLDKQRAYQIVCLMVGADMGKFARLANAIDLPDSRQDTCRGDYSNASWSWERMLAPHRREASAPKTRIEVVYGEGKNELQMFEQSFRAVQLLEMVANHISDQYVWRRPLTLEMQSCGTSAAFWTFSTAKLTLCYELAAEFAQLYRRYGSSVRLPR
jgi:Putative metallopeptidase